VLILLLELELAVSSLAGNMAGNALDNAEEPLSSEERAKIEAAMENDLE
jgi:hypothetical protein